MIRSVLKGLEYLHERNVVHRGTCCSLYSLCMYGTFTNTLYTLFLSFFYMSRVQISSQKTYFSKALILMLNSPYAILGNVKHCVMSHTPFNNPHYIPESPNFAFVSIAKLIDSEELPISRTTVCGSPGYVGKHPVSIVTICRNVLTWSIFSSRSTTTKRSWCTCWHLGRWVCNRLLKSVTKELNNVSMIPHC